ncbi:receptor-like cytosolic serine/threonine-protein kinase RBK1 [Telopea speciosissima]|uniref:receptor-like cytosolic serine/threonine-protein kinase RBK1 n=1 Tax=Telopea speciosissima TaxID=54955 RepID=UPI001CC4CEFD|nr:receptor-like cytosolic serine/threonine-protein kinase RBK1 [Telopea speciosissima]
MEFFSSAMVGRSPRISCSIASILGAQKTTKKNKTIVVGLKAHNRSREVLLRVLNEMVRPGDNVVAVHVQEPQDNFDLNSFEIHEDLCKSKQVEFQVKICVGESFIAVLTHQVRLHFATELVLGCSTTRPEEYSIVTPCLKRLPPTCSLLVISNLGKVLVRKPGTSQEGSTSPIPQTQSLKTHTSPATWLEPGHKSPKQEAKQSSSKATLLRHADMVVQNSKNKLQSPATMGHFHLQRIAILEAKGACKWFTPDELRTVTKEFRPQMVIGEGGHGKLYRAQLADDKAAAVKVLNIKHGSGEKLLREVEILSELNHEHIIRLIGYCYCKDMHSIVYNLLQGSLKQKLKQLTWSERVKVAVGLAKALEYLHHSCSPPIIHRDVNSSNILLSHHCQPQLSNFGEAIVHDQPEQPLANKKPARMVGTFGYLAPEYIMYGKVDEKTDVYSFGVVLLELITGKEATDADQKSNPENLVPWARSLLCQGLCDRLIDPYLQEDYKKEEMQKMMTAARLCLMHSSSRRPTMKVILKLLEEQEYWLRGKGREEFLNWIGSKGEYQLWRHSEIGSRITIMEDI